MKRAREKQEGPVPVGGETKLSPELLDAQTAVQRDFEAFGLSGYEARVLVSLLRAGVATPAELARLSGVHRTSAYPVLEELAAKGLADVRAGKTAVWASPGTEEVLARLKGMEEERLKGLNDRLDRTRAALSKLVPDAPAAAISNAQIVRGAAQVRRIYERLLREARSEVLVFNRPPYTWAPGRTNAVVLDTLKRGIKARVVYQRVQLDGPDADGFSHETSAYLKAGVKARVVDDLPIKLVIVDRKSVLFAMPDAFSETAFPTNLVVEHPGFVAMQVHAFEVVWNDAEPLGRPSASPVRAGDHSDGGSAM